jgi:hypothetical protein
MKGSKIAPWICIMTGLLWFYVVVRTDERRTMAIIFGVVFLLIGLVQLKVNSHRFKKEEPLSEKKDAR